jgi:hypothetical protein
MFNMCVQNRAGAIQICNIGGMINGYKSSLTTVVIRDCKHTKGDQTKT